MARKRVPGISSIIAKGVEDILICRRVKGYFVMTMEDLPISSKK